MIYRNIVLKPGGRALIGYIQFSLIVIYVWLKVYDIGLMEGICSFFIVDGSSYSEAYIKEVSDSAGILDFFLFLFCLVYSIRGVHKVNTWKITGHPGLEVYKTSFWSSAVSLSWWVDFLNTSRPNTSRNGLRGRDNIDSIVGYVEGKNSFSSREKSAQRYAAINNVTMMDDKTRDYVNGRLSWMSRENGYKYIKGLNK